MTVEREHLVPSETPVSLLDHAGNWVPDAGFAMPSDQTLALAYRRMVTGRRINDQAHALVRQGHLAVYPSSHGQKACQVAAAQVLDDGDWLLPTYRDCVPAIMRGVAPVEVLELARKGQATTEELTAGTFTLNNYGSFNVDGSPDY